MSPVDILNDGFGEISPLLVDSWLLGQDRSLSRLSGDYNQLTFGRLKSLRPGKSRNGSLETG
jgi:hypothetical protein